MEQEANKIKPNAMERECNEKKNRIKESQCNAANAMEIMQPMQW